MISLLDLNVNECGIIECINVGHNATQRLCDMGLTKGTEVKMIRRAPINGPIELSVRGTNIIIGRGLASKVFVIKEKEEK